ncbi:MULTISPECIES: hypothetical protein [unclassified Mesorhizobium]|uniref:hypothetical protein n=1 Tax=unclassified Mesorhizobium TaxID=325217 RepID=UPI0012EB1C14|nr:hypothetical protein [Mesorhizobium sp. LSJC268A00]
MTEAIQGYVAWFIILAVGGGVALRLLTAPYFIWKADQDKISSLEKALDSPAQRQRDIIAELMAHQKMKTVEEITRVRRIMVDFDKTIEEKRKAFHGSELYSDKFMSMPMFSSAWFDFYDACNLAFAEWQHAKKLPELGPFARMQFNRASGVVDACAAALIDYLLYDTVPQISPEAREALEAPRNVEAERIPARG